jgi:hypothetical protein
MRYYPQRTHVPGDVPDADNPKHTDMMMNVTDGRLWLRAGGGQYVELVSKNGEDMRTLLRAISLGGIRMVAPPVPFVSNDAGE